MTSVSPVRPTARLDIAQSARFCLLATAVALALPADAQQFVVSTGAAGNTYDSMFQQFAAACLSEVGLPMVALPSAGSMENIDRLINNEVTGAIVQADVLSYRSRLDDLGQVRALFALHPEEVHLLALSEPRKEGGLAGLGGRTVPLNTLADLRGRKVGAWGGSWITAQVMRLQAEVAFALEEFADQAAALKALNDRKVDALLSVGGSPQPWLQKLDRRYRLMAVGDAEAVALKSVYRPARLSYANLGQTGVATVATDALLVTRQYRTPAMSAMLARVRSCFRLRLPELQEKPGNHAKWQAVDVNRRPRWPMAELDPVEPVATGATPSRKSRPGEASVR